MSAPSSTNPPSATAPRTIRLDPRDPVAIAVDALRPGQSAQDVLIRQAVPRGHKFALRRIERGEPIRKFGQIIGFASTDIAPGDWVHEKNVVIGDFARDAVQDRLPAAQYPAVTSATFEGYRRSSGRTGTRNYIGIVASVNCSASVARFAAEAVRASGLLAEYPDIDGIVPIMHGTGCGMASKGEGYDLLRRTLWGYAAHPNFAAVIMVGLGCEVMQVDHIRQEYDLPGPDSFQTLTLQETGGTRKTVAAIVGAVRDIAPAAARVRRQTRPASELMVGLQCGGSDGYSAITANPALGYAADLLVRQGGTAILSETPEIFGAEHLLLQRAARPEVAAALRARLAWWDDYTARHGAHVNNNPSPGNKAGGLTTIYEKSLGAVAKGGTMPLQAVYGYAEPVRQSGLVFMDTPGYDPVSATGQVAGGANLIAFTTGRGSAFGCKPTPSIKLATNSHIYRQMEDDMDIDCGTVLDGVAIADKGAEIFAKMLTVASGERTKSEGFGYGDQEFVPWQIGAVV